ncbi:MAG TPA: ribonuclease III [Caulobacteraceae bacterium]
MTAGPKDRRKAAVAALERTLGHSFTDRDLLERALTHASAGDGAKDVRHNERLEFLGDRVLNLLTAERLMELYPEEREGELTKRMHALISGETCARVAERIGLSEALRLSGGESRRGGRANATILGDACEALLAALYRDAGLDRTREIFDRIWAEEFEAAQVHVGFNPKSELQEWAAQQKLPAPVYEVVSRSGPAHAPTFEVELRIGDLGPVRCEGRSRQVAEKTAAEAFLTTRVRT